MNTGIHYVQTALKLAGYDPGAADGVWGARTRGALDAALRRAAAAELPASEPQSAAQGPSVNKAALDLIKEFEGFRASTYRCPANILTIGYGTTAAAGVGIDPKMGMTITEAEATEYLRKTVEKFAAQIRPKITAPINDNEFGAFVSLAYNIGPGAFNGSTALKRFNAGDKKGAAEAMLMWNRAGNKVLPGLVRRREAERQLFLSVPGGPTDLPAIRA